MIEKITKIIVFKIIKERFVNEVPFLKLLGIKVSKFDYCLLYTSDAADE